MQTALGATPHHPGPFGATPPPERRGRPARGRPSWGRPARGRPSWGRPARGRPSWGRPARGEASAEKGERGEDQRGKKASAEKDQRDGGVVFPLLDEEGSAEGRGWYGLDHRDHPVGFADTPL